MEINLTTKTGIGRSRASMMMMTMMDDDIRSELVLICTVKEGRGLNNCQLAVVAVPIKGSLSSLSQS